MLDIYATEKINKYNPAGTLLVSKVILTLIALNTFFNILLKSTTSIDVYPDRVMITYISLYILLSIVCMTSIILIKMNYFTNGHFTVYVGLVLALGSLITFFDQYYFSHVLVYTSIVILCAQFISLPYKRMVKLFLLQCFVHIGLVLIYIGFSQMTMLYSVYIFSLTVFGILISFSKSNLYRTLTKSDARHLKQLEIEKELTMQLQAMNDHLKQVALTDALVNIPNRLACKKYYDTAIKQGGRYGIVIIDIDYFKQYNDFYGHLHGDVVLKQVAQTLQKQAKAMNGFAARWGGEEFVVLFENMDMDRLELACYALRTSINEVEIPHAKSLVAPFVTISVGATIWDTAQHHIEQALHQADMALYDVKNTARNNVKIVCKP